MIILKKIKFLLILIFTFIFNSCSPKPEPINYGQDVCELCKMNITDNKFAAEIVTNKGKIYKFDSVECLFNFKHLEIDNMEIHSEWVNDFSNPGALINLKEAFFLHSDVFRSPMGLNVLSFSSQEKRDELKNQYGGKELTYQEVFELANQE